MTDTERIDPDFVQQWIVVWRWDDGVVWPLNMTLRRTRRDAIAAFEALNGADYAKERRRKKAKAVRVLLWFP
jgi:hypothetical protein